MIIKFNCGNHQISVEDFERELKNTIFYGGVEELVNKDGTISKAQKWFCPVCEAVLHEEWSKITQEEYKLLRK
jgi:hypothetical protein